MSNEAQSSPDYRYMIRATAGTPGSGEDIRNINTDPLPNGAHCYVIARRACFVLNKNSSVSADNVGVLLPIAGPGRWFVESVASALAPSAQAYSTNPNTFVTDGVLNRPNSALFAIQEGSDAALWDFTAAGCIMTYQGPPTPAIATLTAAVHVTNTAALRAVLGFISVDNDNPGFAAGTTAAGVQEVIFTDQTIQLNAQRRIPALAAGVTIGPKFGSLASAGSGGIDSLQLIVRPG